MAENKKKVIREAFEPEGIMKARQHKNAAYEPRGVIQARDSKPSKKTK